MPDPTQNASWRSLLAVLIFVSVLSFAVRDLSALLVQAPGSESPDWIVTDPDGLYHARRVLRAIQEPSEEMLLPVAGIDPYLDYPNGAAIPWPPYYDLLLALTIDAPGLDDTVLDDPGDPRDAEASDERRRLVEHRVGAWPAWFGVLTTLLVALAGARIAGVPGALASGIYHAFTPAATIYAKLGVADHHAFVAMLLALLLFLLTKALADDADAPSGTFRTGGARWGAACGAVAGLLLGSWVASLVYVALVDVLLGILIVRDSRGTDRALARFGTSFHLAALVILIPAVIDSPWLERQPWSVVNLSQFHPAYLAIGALVFLPLPLLAERPLRRLYPLFVVVALGAIAALLALFDASAWVGLREAFAWADRSDEFMSSIQESRPLWQAVRAGEAGGLGRVQSYLGLGAFLLPIAWIAAVVAAVRSRNTALLPWIVFTPVLLVQALQQTRFTDVLAIPLAVLLGWLVGCLVARLVEGGLKLRRPAGAALSVLFATTLCVGLLQAKSVAAVTNRLRERGFERQYVRMPRQRAARASLDWLRERKRDQTRFGTAPGSVLANWSRGHAIEWAADLPTVATNFGSYLGEASWVDPGRILLESSMPAVEEAMIAREIRWIFVSSEFPNALPTLVRAAFPEDRERFIARTPEGGASLQPAFFDTLGARLMFRGHSPVKSPAELQPIDFLRLVRVSPERDPRPKLQRWAPNSPMNWIWERVPAALLTLSDPEFADRPARISLRLAAGEETFVWSSETRCDGQGTARLRVPYATDSPNGEVRVLEASATCGSRRIELQIPESAVLSGAEIRP